MTPLEVPVFQNGVAHIRVKVISGAPKTEYKEIMADGTWKIRVASVREKGRANEKLIAFLSESLSIPRSHIEIISGATDSTKLIRLSR